MHWYLSNGFDQRARRLADDHYTRQKPGARQFVRGCRRVVLVTPAYDALWVSLWPDHVQHDWPGAWECQLFRNVGPVLSSELIRDAMAATSAVWGVPPAAGMITFVDESAVRSNNPGYCFLQAGFRRLKTRTKERGLRVLRIDMEAMPMPKPALRFQGMLAF